MKPKGWLAWLVAPGLSSLAFAGTTFQEGPKEGPKKDFPSFDEVSKDYEKVVSTTDGKPSLYTVWTREKDGQMLAELPRGYESQKHYFALTTPTGEMFAGLQDRELYVYWKRFDTRMALIAPEVGVRSTGDQSSKDSLQNVFAETVIVDVPIVCMGPGGQPVIDLDALLVGNASTFYSDARGINTRLATIKKAKAFPENIEIAFEAPVAGGELKTFHYSISKITGNASYKPRKADTRVGYFTTEFKDLGKFDRDQVRDRMINRWHLEKADPSLSMSPPKEPIVFYLEHTVPVRYRRYVKNGVLSWNKAFEQVGISDAIVVNYQDKATGAHMDKDPEDVRYNFIRWLSNDIGTAIGPSRAHPMTGEILDADIILTDGWIRAFYYQSHEALPQIAMEGFSAETLRWLDAHPQWDPRVRLASPSQRDRILAERRKRALLGPEVYEAAFGDATVASTSELLDFAAEAGPESMLCLASVGKAESMAFMSLALETMGLMGDDEDDDEDEEEVERIDGIPEWFIGPSLAELVAHEVGHTLGLRHNFKASSIHTLAELNCEEARGGKRPLSASVMDYLPVNAVFEDGKLQGDHAMIGVGPYDMWAIEYGYTFEDPAKVLESAADPMHVYLTDEDTSGPDPFARRYDFTAEPLDYAENLMKIANESRSKILDEFVKDGDSWAKARRGYEITLRSQQSAVSIMSNWLGGVFVSRSNKGEKDGREPLAAVPAEQQRKALKFVIENTFFDDCYGLTPELLSKMTVDKWFDPDNWRAAYEDPTWPIHDRVAGVQASALTQLMNPTTLRRIYDNELLVPASEDVLTLPEMMQTITGSIWQEIGFKAEGGVAIREASASSKPSAFTARRPMISSLRRNLQREHLERLIDLALEGGNNASSKSISLLAMMTLDQIGQYVTDGLEANPDPYTRAHLTDARNRIEKVQEASYTYNGGGGSGMPSGFILFGKDGDAK